MDSKSSASHSECQHPKIINNHMTTQIQLPKINWAAIRSGVRPGKVQPHGKSKAAHQRRPKHQKNWRKDDHSD